MYYACFRPPSTASNVDITVTVDAVSLGSLKSAQATLNLVTPVSVSFFRAKQPFESLVTNKQTHTETASMLFSKAIFLRHLTTRRSSGPKICENNYTFSRHSLDFQSF